MTRERPTVSIHAPTRGATFRRQCRHRYRRVSIHAPTRGATAYIVDYVGVAGFNSRAHAGRDTRSLPRTFTTDGFNSRAHAGRDVPSVGRSRVIMFQFTRPRGARLDERAYLSVGHGFNSRAHAGRDGQPGLISRITVIVSIHAPTRGATVRGGGNLGRDSFNSRAHAGRDSSLPLPLHNVGVSIHAPTRGATARQCLQPTIFRRFNSRAHAGRDAEVPQLSTTTSLFQFTRPRGARRGGLAGKFLNARFQFTRPRGARRMMARMPRQMTTFQFTRPRGARLKCQRIPLATHCFNSRAHAGRDTGAANARRYTRFQFTRPRGARRTTTVFPSRVAEFQFTRPRGARHQHDAMPRRSRAVSIHAPTRGATGQQHRKHGQHRFQFTRPRGARHAALAVGRMI